MYVKSLPSSTRSKRYHITKAVAINCSALSATSDCTPSDDGLLMHTSSLQSAWMPNSEMLKTLLYSVRTPDSQTAGRHHWFGFHAWVTMAAGLAGCSRHPYHQRNVPAPSGWPWGIPRPRGTYVPPVSFGPTSGPAPRWTCRPQLAPFDTNYQLKLFLL